MTPQEKAQELVDKFDCGGLQTFAGHNVKIIAKQCALIAVDEIISIAYWEYMDSGTKEERQYWQQVKTEIEKL